MHEGQTPAAVGQASHGMPSGDLLADGQRHAGLHLDLISLAVYARRVHRGLHIHAEQDVVENHLRHGIQDAGRARRAQDQHRPPRVTTVGATSVVRPLRGAMEFRWPGGR